MLPSLYRCKSPLSVHPYSQSPSLITRWHRVTSVFPLWQRADTWLPVPITSQTRADMITLYHVTSHQSKSDVSFSSWAMMAAFTVWSTYCHVLHGGRQSDKVWAFTTHRQGSLQKKDLPCANKTADAHSCTQPFIISVYLLPVAVPDKKPCFYSNLQWPGCFQGRLHGHQPLWVVQHEFRCASFHLNRKYECHAEKRGWFNSLQWEATGLWVM